MEEYDEYDNFDDEQKEDKTNPQWRTLSPKERKLLIGLRKKYYPLWKYILKE